MAPPITIPPAKTSRPDLLVVLTCASTAIFRRAPDPVCPTSSNCTLHSELVAPHILYSRSYTAVRITGGNRAASRASGKAGHGMSGLAEIDHGTSTSERHSSRAFYQLICSGIMTHRRDSPRADAITMKDVPPDVLMNIIRHCCGDDFHALVALTHVNGAFKDAVMQVRIVSREASLLSDDCRRTTA